MLEILAAYGILSTIINVIALLYDNTEARITKSDCETEFCKRLKGMLQGDTLAIFLFIITLYYVMREK